jgi:two-component system, sensor histidine kinase RegB
MMSAHPSFSVSNRTLITVRWVHISGQILAVLIGMLLLEIQLPIMPIIGCIMLLTAINVFAIAYHRHRRLGENSAAIYLALDITQLALLLYFTGGFENPFSMMMIAPVAVAAAVLNLPRMVLLAFWSILLATLLSIWHQPLSWPGGEITITPAYMLGEQIALIFALAFIASYVWRISYEFRHIQNALHDTQMTLYRQRQLSALGAQAAAAAHELGSPLSTIAIIAKDLYREYANDPELKDDLTLLVEQSRRCSDILKDLSLNPEREEDPLVTSQPLYDLLRDLAAQYHHERPAILVDVIDDPSLGGVTMTHSPELVRGIGNLIQNAIQHAKERVTLTIQAQNTRIRVLIHDDGDGFSPQILARIGEPYLSTKRRGEQNMGLGLFISQTLLASRGVQMRFRNHPDGGAEVMITLPRIDEKEQEHDQG